MAELADAPDLGSGGYTVGVQVPSPAPSSPQASFACGDFLCFAKSHRRAYYAAAPLSQKVFGTFWEPYGIFPPFSALFPKSANCFLRHITRLRRVFYFEKFALLRLPFCSDWLYGTAPPTSRLHITWAYRANTVRPYIGKV